MNRTIRFISMVLASLLLIISCGKKDKVIPRKVMSQIYADMFMFDQWSQKHPECRRQMDTMLVYAPIIEKYGYTVDDYRESLVEYIKDPERFSRILRRTNNILESELKRARKEAEKLDEERQKRREFKSKLSEWRSYAEMTAKADTVVSGDSIWYRTDTSKTLMFVFHRDKGFDTLYIGPELKFPPASFARIKARRDSLARIDSLFRCDSLFRRDSIARRDSLFRVDSIARADSLKKALKQSKTLSRSRVKSNRLLTPAGKESTYEKNSR